MQGAQNVRSEAYLQCTPPMDFLRSHQIFLTGESIGRIYMATVNRILYFTNKVKLNLISLVTIQ